MLTTYLLSTLYSHNKETESIHNRIRGIKQRDEGLQGMEMLGSVLNTRLPLVKSRSIHSPHFVKNKILPSYSSSLVDVLFYFLIVTPTCTTRHLNVDIRARKKHLKRNFAHVCFSEPVHRQSFNRCKN